MTTDNQKEKTYTSESNRTFRIWPYANVKDTLKATEQYTSLKQSTSDKRKILDKLLITDDYFADASPLLISAFQRLEPATRHTILDNIIRLIIKGVDFTPIATDIAKLMCDSNYQFREKAANLLIHMGESALPATTRLITFLRNKLPDIQLSAVRVISAIGPECAELALPKLKSLLNATNPKELVQACEQAIRVLNGEEKPLRPKIKIEGVIEKESNTGKFKADDFKEDASIQPSSSFPAIKGKTILIAEDQDSVRSMISKAVTTCGANTKETSDGEMVLKIIQAKIDVDLFILDLMMPKVNGSEVLRIIRETPQYALKPVFIVSARTERSIMMKMAQLEVAAYITKPFKLAELLTTVNNTFEQN